MAKEITSSAYQKLYRAIVREIGAGALRLKGAYQQEVVRTHWQIGRVLNQMLDMESGPSAENAETIHRLARDLKRQEAFLYGAARFQRMYPALPRTGLSMSHYLLLLSVKDEKLRGRLEVKAAREKINIKSFQVMVRMGLQKQLTQATPRAEASGRAQIPVVRGKLYHYRVLGASTDDPKRMLVDIGFGIERDVRRGRAGSVAGGHIVRTVKQGEDYSVRISDSEKDRLYTYRAAVLRVVDGDTSEARINLGFRTRVTTTLRLRGIDCPEMSSTAGRAAAMFVRETLKGCAMVVVKTYIDEKEKFGRMLADLFYLPASRASRDRPRHSPAGEGGLGEEDPEKILSEGTFLNQELLDKGYAVPYSV